MTELLPTKTIQHFVPSEQTQRSLRDAFGRFATGVTVVTVGTDEGPIAITANSFASVSMEPPLVLWSPQKSSKRSQYFCHRRAFRDPQFWLRIRTICAGASQKTCMRCPGLDLVENSEGVPLIDGCLARFECRQHAVHDGGDHDIIVGRVLRAAFVEEGDGLGFFKGKMNRIVTQ
jgi:flavin reductase (DIM6/NTAB) family NADH-FMN oxidoreductase RutF